MGGRIGSGQGEVIRLDRSGGVVIWEWTATPGVAMRDGLAGSKSFADFRQAFKFAHRSQPLTTIVFAAGADADAAHGLLSVVYAVGTAAIILQWSSVGVPRRPRPETLF